MPGLKGIQNGTEFFWPKWFQKIIGGSYIIAFHSEITAGSDKNKDAVFDEECAGELARRFTRAKLISMIELTEDTRTTITDAPGTVHLNGQEALWYARNRGLKNGCNAEIKKSLCRRR